jgi:hypothetical protein
MGPNTAAARPIATVLGVDLLISVIALVLFFTIGAPFGAINDWTIALSGVLGVVLTLMLRTRSTVGVVLTAFGVVGWALVLVGSLLVISRTTGFLLGGLVESFGFALVGVWLIAINRSPDLPLAQRLRVLGVVAGVVMLVGIVVLPAILSRADDMATAPAYVWLGFVGWIGIFILLPIWAMWFGRQHRSSDERNAIAS